MRKRLPAAVLGLALSGDPQLAIAQSTDNPGAANSPKSDSAAKDKKDHEEIREPTIRDGQPQPRVNRGRGCRACGGCAYSPCQSDNPPEYCKTK